MELYTKHLILRSPEDKDKLWNYPWEILTKDDKEELKGRISFYGGIKYGEIELQHDLPQETIEKGLAKEALRMFLDWAFKNKELFFIHTTVTTDAEEKLFKSIGFIDDGENSEGKKLLRWRTKTYWGLVYGITGGAMGAAWGYFINQWWVCLCVGAFLGVTIGQFVERSDLKKIGETLKKRRAFLDSQKAKEAEAGEDTGSTN